MKRFFAMLLLLTMAITLFSCGETHIPDSSAEETTSTLDIQPLNKNIEFAWTHYTIKCEWAGLDALCNDIFANAEKPLKYVYRSMQYVTFDVVYEDGFADGGIHNYDVYIYEDGTAEMVYRHGLEEGKTYIIDTDIRFEMTAEEIALFENTVNTWDFENIPTWDPEVPIGMDGEITYILKTDDWSRHLAARWCASEDSGVYHIRTVMEEIAKAHG